ncbi:GNAT family N-acetyltransferase [Brevundimonas sp.]|uniref:GNAT family N-acetyltransferase n=1 Tax=Brevundimonas sp. TaxID=1871086 RepID=UPI003AF4CB8F
MTDFRPATPDDLEPLHALVHAAYRGDSARRGWTHEADLLDGSRIDRDSLLSAITSPGQVVLVAADDDTLTACVHVTDRGEGLAYLGMLTVNPCLQAKGLGRRLIAAAEAHAFRHFRTRRMEMTVIVHRPELIAWYQRRGYVLTGETRPFPATDPRFGLPKRDDLAFTVLEKPLDRLVTDRLVLRPARLTDLDALHAVFTRPEAMTWWSSPPHETLDQTRAWLDSMIARQDSGLDYLIERNGQVIGKAGFWKAPDIGYILHPDHWGQGFAREAVVAVLHRLFAVTGHDKATADVDPDNAASIRLLESLGFHRTGFAERTWNVGGEWKDSYFYAVSREEWLGRTDA